MHVNADLQITRDVALPDPPRHQLSRADLSERVLTAQHPFR